MYFKVNNVVQWWISCSCVHTMPPASSFQLNGIDMFAFCLEVLCFICSYFWFLPPTSVFLLSLKFVCLRSVGSAGRGIGDGGMVVGVRQLLVRFFLRLFFGLFRL